VPRDRSLDEFTGGHETESEGGSPEAEGDPPREEEKSGANGVVGSSEETPNVDSIGTTYGSSPGGSACESCGATVQGRWRDDERWVCVDCKDW